MDKKKRSTLLGCVIFLLLIAGVITLLVLLGRDPYQGDLTLTDEAGEPVEDVTALQTGDVVNVTVVMRGKNNETELSVIGLQATLTASGLAYNGDGVPFDEVANVSYKEQLVNDTVTVDFLYYDLAQQGITVSNPCTVGTCSFTVTDPDTASVEVTTGLVYPADGTSEYEIVIR